MDLASIESTFLANSNCAGVLNVTAGMLRTIPMATSLWRKKKEPPAQHRAKTHPRHTHTNHQTATNNCNAILNCH
eukprot:123569-Lingulodinium_polyedra.AAC.1